MTDAKKAFQKISKQQAADLPFSLHYQWWNEVVSEGWEVAVYEEKGEIRAIWPYLKRKKGPFSLLVQPPFTPYGGPIFNFPPDQKRERRYSSELKYAKGIVNSLPKFSELLINCRLSLNNTLPFIWEGFEDRKKFTHILKLDQSNEELFIGFRDNIRRQIRKAEKHLSITTAQDPMLVGKLLKESFSGQSESYPIEDESIYRRIGEYLKKYEFGEILQAVNEAGEVHAIMVWIHDAKSAYYLIGGTDQNFKNSGAMSYLMWEAIQKAKAKNIPAFNFEGSMIPSVEKYLRGFGGKLTPYSCLVKNNSSGLKLLRKLR